MERSERVEFLIETAAAGVWPGAEESDFRKVNENYIPDLDLHIPYQWQLVRYRPPEARATLRQMATELRQGCDDLLALLDTMDAAEREAEEAGHPEWVRFLTLLRAPFPIPKPEVADHGDVDTVALVINEVRFGGSWPDQIADLEQHGSEEQKAEDLPYTRSLASFEETYGVSPGALYFSEQDRRENAALHQAFLDGGLAAMKELSGRDGEGRHSSRRPRRGRRRRRKRK